MEIRQLQFKKNKTDSSSSPGQYEVALKNVSWHNPFKKRIIKIMWNKSDLVNGVVHNPIHIWHGAQAFAQPCTVQYKSLKITYENILIKKTTIFSAVVIFSATTPLPELIKAKPTCHSKGRKTKRLKRLDSGVAIIASGRMGSRKFQREHKYKPSFF